MLRGFSGRETEAIALAASDAVCVAYKDHALMSAVFCQAMCSGVPIISPNYGLLAWLAGKYCVGIAVDIQDPLATGNALARLFEDRASYTEYCENARRHAQEHAPSAFGRAVCESVLESRSTVLGSEAVTPRPSNRKR